MLFINDANILLKWENLNIKILRIDREVFFESFPRHKHGKSFYELHYILKGKGTLLTDGGSCELYENTVYMTGPLVYHQQITDEKSPMEEYCIQMEVAPTGKVLPEGELFCRQSFWIGEDKHDVKMLFEMIEKESNHKGIGYIQAVKNIVALILVAMIRNYSGDEIAAVYEKNTPDYMRMSITEESFFKDYQGLTLTRLSTRLGLSNRQTQRLLMKNYSKTFSELLTEAKVSKAEEFIRSGMSINDAAYAVGYADVRSLKKRMEKGAKK